jgi:HEAT repeat protein
MVSKSREQFLQAMFEQLRCPDAPYRVDAVYRLRKIPDSRINDMLFAALQDNDSYVRLAAGQCLILREVHKDAALNIIAAELNHRIANVRATAVAIIGWLGEKGASELITPLVHDPDSQVRLQVVDALYWLGRAGIKGIIEPLVQAAYDDEKEISRLAIINLKQLRTPMALDFLSKLRHDENDWRRIWATDMLTNNWEIWNQARKMYWEYKQVQTRKLNIIIVRV